MTSSVPRKSPVDSLRLDTALRQTLHEFEEQQKQQRNVAMVAYRKTKKEAHKRNHSERHQLERQLKQLVESVRAAAARSSQVRNANQTPAEALCGLVAEQKLLRIENLALREEIRRNESFRVLLDSEPFREGLSQNASSQWRVEFDRNVPCFHFSPFTRDKFDEEINQFELELALSASSLTIADEFLGWSVHRAPLVTSTLGSTVARVRLAKRVRYPFDIILGRCYAKSKDLSPIVVSPVDFGIRQYREVSTQLLQKFDQDALVFVHNIPSPNKHLRYIYFARHTQWLMRNGRRKHEFSMVIVSPHDKREAKGLQENVEWVEEGGLHVSMIEGDDTFMDIVSDRWASCQSKLQANYNMVQWAQYASWWEQTVAPDRLLL